MNADETTEDRPMNVRKLLSKYKHLDGDICITDGESDLYIGYLNFSYIEQDFEDYEELMTSEVIELKSNTTATSGWEQIEIVLEITVKKFDYEGAEE